MKTAISLPDELFERADELAKRTGRSRSELYVEALREYLARHLDDDVTAQLDELCEELDTSLPSDIGAANRRMLRGDSW